jgi:hypothetical protein
LKKILTRLPQRPVKFKVFPGASTSTAVSPDNFQQNTAILNRTNMLPYDQCATGPAGYCGQAQSDGQGSITAKQQHQQEIWERATLSPALHPKK